MVEPTSCMWQYRVQDVGVHGRYIYKVEESSSPPLHCPVSEAVVGQQLIAFIYTSDVLVELFNDGWLSDVFTTTWGMAASSQFCYHPIVVDRGQHVDLPFVHPF